MKEADNLVSLIRELIRNELASMDQTAVCVVESVNPDGSLNIYIMPDTTTVVRNVTNASKYDLKAGDAVVLYKIKNKSSNSFVIAKFGR